MQMQQAMAGERALSAGTAASLALSVLLGEDELVHAHACARATKRHVS